MKKALSVFLAIILMVSFAACAATSVEEVLKTAPEPTPEPTLKMTPAAGWL